MNIYVVEDAVCQDEKQWGRNRLDSALEFEKHCHLQCYLEDKLAYREHEMTVPGILRLDVNNFIVVVQRREWSLQDGKK